MEWKEVESELNKADLEALYDSIRDCGDGIIEIDLNKLKWHNGKIKPEVPESVKKRGPKVV